MGKGDLGEDIKRYAVRQIAERGYPVAEISKRLGSIYCSLNEWRKKFSEAPGAGDDE
jgi:transposase-like protein